MRVTRHTAIYLRYLQLLSRFAVSPKRILASVRTAAGARFCFFPFWMLLQTYLVSKPDISAHCNSPVLDSVVVPPCLLLSRPVSMRVLFCIHQKETRQDADPLKVW